MIEKYLNNRFLILYVIPFILGSLATLTFEPFNLTLINFLILPSFFYFLTYINKKSRTKYRKKPYKKNFLLFGLAFGFGFYLSGISWITNSLTFDENFKVLIPFALVLIPLFLSLFLGITSLLIGPYLKLDFSSLLLFSASLAFSDYLRSNILSGFPWNLWAYSTIPVNEILQIVNLTGIYAYNLFTITIFTLPIIFIFKISRILKLFSFLFAFLFVFSLYIHGNYTINKNKVFLESDLEKIYVKVISPNFDLQYGLGVKEIEKRLKNLIRYSDPDKTRKTLFIWPEGVFSGYSYKEILIFKELILNNFSNNHYIIFGVNLLEPKSGSFYNSMLVVNNNFDIIQSYKKIKLVPFGEFVPFENIFNIFGFKKITEGYGSFLKGEENKSLKIGKLNILPLICYEVIFPDLIKKSDKSTNLIINVSEDGWFGESIGPDQHFAKTIFRAIESNSFVVRSANKGITAFVNNNGQVIKSIKVNETGNLEYKIPIAKKQTKNKNDLIFFMLLITYILIFITLKKND